MLSLVNSTILYGKLPNNLVTSIKELFLNYTLFGRHSQLFIAEFGSASVQTRGTNYISVISGSPLQVSLKIK